VPRALLEECLKIAMQAPNGSNFNRWHWIVADDPAMVAQVAGIYRATVHWNPDGLASRSARKSRR